MKTATRHAPNFRPRVDIADVLRGIAVIGILMLHSVEHFDYYTFPPEASNRLLAFFDQATWDSLFFAFSGKAYAIFALLFGYTFFLQDERARREGRDFRPRFVWRLVLLAAFGVVNSAFYPGEVLGLYAIVGLVLPMVARLPDRAVLAIASGMLLAPDLIWTTVRALTEGGEAAATPNFYPWWQATVNAIDTGDFWKTLYSNITDGRIYCLVWSLDYGRVVQAPALMMMGMLVGRRGLFDDTEKNIAFWSKAALVAILCFFPLKGVAEMLPEWVDNQAVAEPLGMLAGAWQKLAFMVFMTSAIIVVFHRTRLRGALMRFVPIGRMSLTMYIAQSMIGSALFHPWGLGLAARLGSVASLGVGIGIFAILYTFAALWLSRHRQGPLEWLWRKATWI